MKENENNNITFRWNYSLTNCNCMFAYLNIIEIDFSNFDTSKVTFMGCMFHSTTITSLDLNHFDTSLVTNMIGMFDCCTNLKLLNLNNFNTNNLEKYVNIFNQANSELKICIPNSTKIYKDYYIKVDCNNICFGNDHYYYYKYICPENNTNFIFEKKNA